MPLRFGHAGDFHLDEDRYFGDTAQCAVAFRGAWRPATGTPTAGGQPRPSVSLCGGRRSLGS